jgi:cytolysin-activating lysine-acyltransferase
MAFWSKKETKQPAAAPPAPDLSRPAAVAPPPPPAPEPVRAASPAPIAAPAPEPTAPLASAPARPTEFRPSERQAHEFGKIAVVMMASPRHRKQPMGEFYAQVMPCLLTGQYMIAGAKPDGRDTSDPIAVLLWASVSDAVDQRVAAAIDTPITLAPNEWRSGNHVWVVDAVGPGKIIEAMLTQLSTNALKGQTVKIRRKNQAGQTVVDTWPLASAMAAG